MYMYIFFNIYIYIYIYIWNSFLVGWELTSLLRLEHLRDETGEEKVNFFYFWVSINI